MDTTFWQHLEQLIRYSSVEIDRPKGTPHPRYPESIYPADYGYLAGTASLDGGGIDVWCGSGARTQVTGVLCTADLLKREVEIKILLGCTDEEMQIIERFQNQGDQRSYLVRR